MSWEQEMGKKKSDPSARAQRTRAKLSLLVTNCFEWNWDLERLWFNLIVSCIECTSSCIECVGWKLGCLEVWWLGGIYSPNHQSGRWGGCLSTGALDSLVRHRTLSGAPATSPNRWGSTVGALRLLAPALTMHAMSAHCTFTVHFCRWPLAL
jgi:hypothetical protein